MDSATYRHATTIRWIAFSLVLFTSLVCLSCCLRYAPQTQAPHSSSRYHQQQPESDHDGKSHPRELGQEKLSKPLVKNELHKEKVYQYPSEGGRASEEWTITIKDTEGNIVDVYPFPSPRTGSLEQDEIQKLLPIRNGLGKGVGLRGRRSLERWRGGVS